MDTRILESGPWRRFDEFIAPEANRLSILISLLDQFRLCHREEIIAGNTHILLGPGPEKPGLETTGTPSNDTTLVAHYDRAGGSPGANDNSAAVFMLLEAAMRLRETGPAGEQRWLIIFTDKEELNHGDAIQDQGSYTLARTLRKSGRGRGRFYIFDACGIGDWLIISTMADFMLRGENGTGIAQIRRHGQQLRDHALAVTRKLNLDKVLLAPVPFSDDVGFLRAGITAQTITALPSAEANRLASDLRNRPGFANALISGEARSEKLIPLFPETWKTLNGPGDVKDLLTPEHFRQTIRFAAGLCGG
jgi:hypothetical protein